MDSISKKPNKTRKRHAIRLFIGYEQDAQEIVKRFTAMKRRYHFQSTVDLFSWLLQVADTAEKPIRLPRVPVRNEAAELKSIHSNNKKVTRRRKQEKPLKTSVNNIKLESDFDSRLESNSTPELVSEDDIILTRKGFRHLSSL